jgi:acetolactate synthase I/II/III large subunit
MSAAMLDFSASPHNRSVPTGAEVLLNTLIANGINTCFMNPGTSEMHFVAALDRVSSMRGILCLFEGVCSGAADGYARAKGTPAATLLHLGPGLANGLANFHNARKARVPVVSIVGEHSTAHLRFDAPLSANIENFARTVSDRVRTARSAHELGSDMSATIADAIQPPGQVAMLIVPADLSWSPSEGCGAVVQPRLRRMPSQSVINRAADLLRQPGTALLLGGSAVTPPALDAAARLSAATGVRVHIARNVPKIWSGRGRFQPTQVPYFPEPALALFADIQNLVLVEAKTPVSFFGYPNTPGCLVPDSCRLSVLAGLDEDGTGALEALAEACPPVIQAAGTTPTPLETGPLTLDAIGSVIAAYLPEDTLISEEMVSSAGPVLGHLKNAAPHEWMPVTGGSIGQALPVAVGAAVACPGRKVLALEADGSGMYTLQALWTMAREKLDVLTVIFANRRYAILDVEMRRTGAHGFGPAAAQLIDIGNPDLDWLSLAGGMGVPATCCTSAAEFALQFRTAVREKGPQLIEAIVV